VTAKADTDIAVAIVTFTGGCLLVAGLCSPFGLFQIGALGAGLFLFVRGLRYFATGGMEIFDRALWAPPFRRFKGYDRQSNRRRKAWIRKPG
jgi:hypothetical protein